MAAKAKPKAPAPVAGGGGEIASSSPGRAQRIQTEDQAVGAEAQATDAAANPPAPSTPAPAAPTAQEQQDAANGQSASQQIASFLSSIPGLNTLDPTGQLAAWMNSQVGALAGQGIDSGTIVNTIESTVNNPSNDPGALAVFNSIFPGYNDKIANGTTNTNGSYTGLAGYLQYANQIQSFAATAGLPAGTVTAADIGNLWAGDVSAGEVSDRITSAYTAATNTPKDVQDYLQNTYGIGPGGIAGYYLNPTNALASLSSVNTGIAGVQSGFGDLTKAQSDSLSAFLATPSSNGMNMVSSQQATQALQGGLGGGISGSAAQLAKGGFETTAPGQSSTGTVNQDTLIAGVEGNAGALQQIEHAQESRTAGAKGGGGATTTGNGAVGLGFAGS